MNHLPLISVVAPAYNEADILHEFCQRTINVMKQLQGFTFELVLVNDGSTDNTLEVLRQLKAIYQEITVVNLSRNFGKEIAMTAGLAESKGDAVVVIDTDLQDPPELIPDLVAHWQSGFDMVYAKRRARHGDTWLKKVTAKVFYRFMSKIGDTPIPENVGDFRLLSRRVVDAILSLPEQHRFMKGIFAWVGFPQVAVEYDREQRFGGETKWSYWKLWNFAIEGITSFTITPLIVATYLGFTTAIASFIYGIIIVFKSVIFGESVQGFPTLMVTILFLGGVQLIVLGLIGEYLGRTFNEAKRRPLYFIESVDPSIHDKKTNGEL